MAEYLPGYPLDSVLHRYLDEKKEMGLVSFFASTSYDSLFLVFTHKGTWEKIIKPFVETIGAVEHDNLHMPKPYTHSYRHTDVPDAHKAFQFRVRLEE